MKCRKLSIPSLWGNEDYESEFIKLMGEVIRASGVDPEVIPQLMYRVYRDELELPFAGDYK